MVNFPTSLDVLTNPVAGGPGVGTDVSVAGALKHSAQHGVLNDAIEAIEAKIGINSSADTTSIDYRLALNEGYWSATYTPTLTQSATVTKTLEYLRMSEVGKTVRLVMSLAITGAGTAANAVLIGLPYPPAVAFRTLEGNGRIYDSSAGQFFVGFPCFETGQTISLMSSAFPSGKLGQNAFTAGLASGDLVELAMTYERS